MIFIEELGQVEYGNKGNKARMGLYKCPQCNSKMKLFHQNVLKRKGDVCSTCVKVNRNTTHGLSREPFYEVWNNMMGRCYRPSTPQFKDWGGRGISVCAEWHDPKCFQGWFMKNHITGLQIDRRDNDGNYEPSNCRFVTRSVNAENQRTRSDKIGKYKYVNWSSQSQKWKVVYKGKYLGLFENEDEAYKHLAGKIDKGI